MKAKAKVRAEAKVEGEQEKESDHSNKQINESTNKQINESTNKHEEAVGGYVYDGLIEFSDFFATFTDIVNQENQSDGISFLPLLTGKEYYGRETAYVYYDPQWSKRVNQYRGQFARTSKYKLYDNGNFFNLETDPLEKNPLNTDNLSDKEIQIREVLQAVLNDKPALPEEDSVD